MGLPALLRRGAAAGAAGGLSAALVMWLVVEPVIRRALVVEQARGGHGHEEPLVSRTAQIWGGLVTTVLVGVIFGVVFTVVFARLRPRLPASTDLGRSMVLATLGFAVLTLLPALHIPGNPPGVGAPETVNVRTLLYVLTVLLGLLGVGAVLAGDRALRGLVTDPTRAALNVLVAVAWLVAVLVLVPGSPDQVAADVPAELLWDFRLASVVQMAVMWLGVGVVFGLLVDDRTLGTRRVARSTV
jgi:predicted cobalt transporter CbtA